MLIDCLVSQFVYLRFIVPLENFSFIWRCHWTSVYNGHLRGPVTLTPITERLGVDLSLPVFTNQVCRGRNSNTRTSSCVCTCEGRGQEVLGFLFQAYQFSILIYLFLSWNVWTCFKFKLFLRPLHLAEYTLAKQEFLVSVEEVCYSHRKINSN